MYNIFCFHSLALMRSAGCCIVTWACWTREQPPSSKCAPASGLRPSLRLEEPSLVGFCTLVSSRRNTAHFTFISSNLCILSCQTVVETYTACAFFICQKKRKKFQTKMRTKANSCCSQSHFYI